MTLTPPGVASDQPPVPADETAAGGKAAEALEVRAYCAAADPYAAIASAALNDLLTYSNVAVYEPSVLRDKEWRVMASKDCAAARAAAQQIAAIAPVPRPCLDLDRKLRQIGALLEGAANRLTAGVERRDTKTIQVAARETQKMVPLVRGAATSIAALRLRYAGE